MAHFYHRFVYEFNRVKSSSENNDNSVSDTGVQTATKKTD